MNPMTTPPLLQEIEALEAAEAACILLVDRSKWEGSVRDRDGRLVARDTVQALVWLRRRGMRSRPRRCSGSWPRLWASGSKSGGRPKRSRPRAGKRERRM